MEMAIAEWAIGKSLGESQCLIDYSPISHILSYVVHDNTCVVDSNESVAAGDTLFRTGVALGGIASSSRGRGIVLEVHEKPDHTYIRLKAIDLVAARGDARPPRSSSYNPTRIL